jgi:hypothetical protein
MSNADVHTKQVRPNSQTKNCTSTRETSEARQPDRLTAPCRRQRIDLDEPLDGKRGGRECVADLSGVLRRRRPRQLERNRASRGGRRRSTLGQPHCSPTVVDCEILLPRRHVNTKVRNVTEAIVSPRVGRRCATVGDGRDLSRGKHRGVDSERVEDDVGGLICVKPTEMRVLNRGMLFVSDRPHTTYV